MPDKIIFTADLHGKREHYEELFSLAENPGARTIIIGGDLTPHGYGLDGILKQRKFLTDFLVPRLDAFSAAAPGIEVFLMMGNDDWRVNMDVLRSNAGRSFRLLEAKGNVLADGTLLIGYPFVPITPFRLKDWEKWDKKLTGQENFFGLRSTEDGIEEISLEERKHEKLETDLLKISGEIEPHDFIFVSHSPPYGTLLDLISPESHVGSQSIREFLEKHSPRLSLHGHIHESPYVSKRYKEKLAGTLCVNPGQSFASKLHAVIFEAADPEGTISHTIFG
ncbi:MAG: metallophosphoesterase [Candidatus Eisenbacteria bacterium]|nr:metallophosphoesterase [Candidatus Eisenbacteria bacterium]